MADATPMTFSGKIKRSKMRELSEQELGRVATDSG